MHTETIWPTSDSLYLNMPLPWSLDPSLPRMFLDECSDFADIFEKKVVETLMLCCLYDCPIDLKRRTLSDASMPGISRS